ncbi:TetR/AcrR family transcriptional regulator [Massilia niabensis]|uniref:TetR/AcrR family transcriptional regulator n=1 Tax=Massilia niabensis TaxID=544910 RepID=A0ABW0LDZ8_9BURK
MLRPKISIRDAGKQLTRERLMDSAYALFAEFGFKEVSIQQIMKHAQANRATFYLHFNDKLDIAWAITKREAGRQDVHRFKELDAFQSPSLEIIQHWVQCRVDSVSANPSLACVFQEAITTEARFAAEYASYLARVYDRVLVNIAGNQEVRVRPVARSKFVLIVTMMDRFILHSCYHKLNFSGDASIEAMAEMLWEALFSNHPRISEFTAWCAERNEQKELPVG